MRTHSTLLSWVFLFIMLAILPVNMTTASLVNPDSSPSGITNDSARIDLSVYQELSHNGWVRALVRLKQAEALQTVRLGIPDTEYKLIEEYPIISAFTANLTQNAINILQENQYVVSIDVEKIGHVDLDASVPLINVRNSVWDLGYTGETKTVCVIDTGIDYTHPALGGCFGNGTNFSCKVIGGYDFYTPGGGDGNPMDDNGHGTHVAGIIASSNSTWKGVAYGAKLVALKACDSTGDNCPEAKVQAAVQWCLDNRSIFNISVIVTTVSYGGEYSSSTCPISFRPYIQNATNLSVPVVISSGNAGHVNGIAEPACDANAISVGAVYDDTTDFYYSPDADCFDQNAPADRITCFSNRGETLSLVAPGASIYSTWWPGQDFLNRGGTSQASPHVAGAIALLQQKNSSLKPSEIKKILHDTGIPVVDNGKSAHNADPSGDTFNRIDVLAAINYVCGCTAWTNQGCGSGSCGYNERRYTRSCNGTTCTNSSYEKCVHDETCITGTIRSVCKSGCSYSTVQSALNVAESNDLIKITDNDTYRENIKWPQIPAGGITLDCQGANITGVGSGRGIAINDSDFNTIRYCNIWGFGYGISINSSSGDNKIKYNNITNNSYGIIFEDSAQMNNYVIFNNISNNSIGGIYFLGTNANNDARNNIIQDNIISNNKNYSVRFRYGALNIIRNNIIQNHTYGIYLDHSTSNGFATVSDNRIYQNSYAVYFETSNTNTLSNNTLCSPSINNDITLSSSSSNTGDLNRCEKPGTWNDSSVSAGCTYLCNYAPNVTLVIPANGTVIYDSNITLTCAGYDSDNFNLSNVTLYHNIGGTWQANQSANLSSLTDSATFTINNVSNGTYRWNCKIYDQDYYGAVSKSDWGDYNYTFNVSTAVIFSITGFKEIYSSGTKKVFEFWINNPRADALNNISWSLRTGDNTTINSTLDFGLNGNDNAFVIVEYNYSSSGTYNASLNVTANGINKTASILVSPGSNLLVLNLSVINSTARNRTFEFKIKNQIAINMSTVRWNMTLGNGRSINATQSIDLSPYEEMSVFVEYNYSSASTYTVNATARNGTNSQSIINSKNISVTVT